MALSEHSLFMLAQSRWELLQFLSRDMKCSNPQEYLTDCGECLRCCMTYRDGAMRFREATGGYIPGQRLDERFERFIDAS